MRRSVRVLALGMTMAAAIAAQAGAGVTKDHAQRALNIIPSGQYGGLPVPPNADEQARMYDALTPLFDQVSDSDLDTYFKSELFGVGPDGPTTVEPVPRPGVTIERDRFGVPHVTGATHDDGVWAAGWIAASDRRLLGEQARYNARVAAIDVPNLSAIGLVVGLESFVPSEQTEAEIAKQSQVLEAAGKEGRAVMHDIDVFVSGINDFIAAKGLPDQPWTRNDIFAVNALKGQFLGQGGGDEARRSMFLAGLQQRLGAKKGKKVFDDLRQFKNPELPTSIDGRFPYGKVPKRAKGSVLIDPGSFHETEVVPNPRRFQAPVPEQASNTLMVTRDRSKSKRPLMVGGPQIGYFYPGLTWEIDMHAGDLQWRGATSAPFPGYLLIGRGPDFANTLTSASGDIIDQYVETLCNGSDSQYLYKGECLPMERFDAGTLNGKPVSFMRTVHGPVVGYATVEGERVAISQKRSSYGKDTLDQLFFRRLSNGQVDSPESFFKAASKTPQTFNSFYIDNEHIAEFTSGRLPIRHPDVDPGLPTIGTGKYEWQGFLGRAGHPQGIDPKDGTITNWNQGAARGFGAADDEWGRNGSVGRTDLLDRNLERLRRGGKWTHASVTSAMNAAATQDVRAIVTVPLLRRLLQGSTAPNAQAQAMLDVLVGWRQRGGSRLDRDLDGLIDDPGAAIMDRAWPKIADNFLEPRLGPQLDELGRLFSRWDAPPGGQYSGWYQYLDRDLRKLLGMKIRAPFRVNYCGAGNKAACRQAIWQGLADAGAALEAEQGTADPNAWKADATAERIEFAPGLLAYTMRYTNRPSGIQQVISFKSHR
jgi:acyl-homoserine lactone acylase PvdQ